MRRLTVALALALTTCISWGQELGSPLEPPTASNAPVSTVANAASPRAVRHVSARTFVTSRARKQGWIGAEWDCLDALLWAESSWNPESANPHSSAYGLFQLLKLEPGTPLPKQVERGFRYIRHRYGSPCRAWAFHKVHNYY